MSPLVFSLRAVGALFLQRQQLDRPRARRLTAASLARFAEDVGGIRRARHTRLHANRDSAGNRRSMTHLQAAARRHPRRATFMVLLTALAACGGASGASAACPFGIPPAAAKRLFEQVKAMPIGDGYRFEGVSTDAARALVRWSHNGAECPQVRVDFQNCTPLFGLPSLRLDVPPALAVECPGVQAAVTELSSAWSARDHLPPAPFPPAAPLHQRISIAAVILVAGTLLRALLAPKGGRAFGRVAAGWTAFILIIATPFLLDPLLAVSVELGAAWIVLAVLLLDRDLLAAESRTWALSLLGLALGSLLLHGSLSSGGPGDLRLNLAGIASPELELRWGPAPIALFRLLGFVLGRLHDTDIRGCNLILSAVLPVLLYAIVVQLGVSRRAALLAGVVAAAHPLLIAFSGVLERQPTYLFAAFGSILGLLGFLQRGRWRPFAAFVLGAVLATTSRPEGAHVLVVHCAVVLVVSAPRWARAVAALALAALTALALVYVRHILEVSPPRGDSLVGRAPFAWTVLVDRDFTPLAWIVAWMLGLTLGLRRRAAWVALVALLGLDIAWRWTGLYHMFVGHAGQIASARYETILLVPFAIGVALFFQALPAAGARVTASALAAFIVLTAATFQRPYDAILRPFTVDYEYRFLKQSALKLPPGSRVYTLDSPLDDAGLIDARLVGLFAGSTVDFASWLGRECDDLLRDASPTYLYIGSSCAELIDSPTRPLPIPEYIRWIEDCTAIHSRLAGGVVEEIEVPARRMSWHDFKQGRVRLGLYRLTDPSICALGPRTSPPTPLTLPAFTIEKATALGWWRT